MYDHFYKIAQFLAIWEITIIYDSGYGILDVYQMFPLATPLICIAKPCVTTCSCAFLALVTYCSHIGRTHTGRKDLRFTSNLQFVMLGVLQELFACSFYFDNYKHCRIELYHLLTFILILIIDTRRILPVQVITFHYFH